MPTTLLHYIYTTPPMLNAAPGERLVFPIPSLKEPEVLESFVPLMDKLSKRQKKDFNEKMTNLRVAFEQRSLLAPSRKLMVRERLDPDYVETAAWVNSLAGSVFPDGDVPIEFDNSVWHSEARSGHAEE